MLSSDHFDQLVRYIDKIKDKQKEKIELKNDSNIKRLLKKVVLILAKTIFLFY